MHEQLWQKIVSHVSQAVDAHRFETWFKPLVVAKESDATSIVLAAPNQFMCDFLSQHYLSTLLSTARSLSPQIESLRFVPQKRKAAATPVEGPADAHKYRPAVASPSPNSLLNTRYTFDSFVVGSGNEFARSAALAVAQAPGKTKFNPLLIYGGVGLGKTHLAQAIGNYMQAHNKNCKVAYVTSEDFCLNFVDALKNNSIKSFSERFRSADILSVDDVQFLSGKEGTQEEFFFIFNTLYQNGKQIVLTSDLPPPSLKGLQDRLISRFQWGLCVDIQPPNLETRVAILKKKAEEGNLNIPQNVLAYIAENVSSNVRQLEGVILRLLAYSSIMKNDITMDLVKEVLKGSGNKEKPRVTIDEIIELVSEYYKVPVNNLREKNRRQEVAHARQVAMYIAKSVTNYSLKTIGLNFGGRDHSTVIHAISQVQQERDSDPGIGKEIDYLLHSLGEE
jgi:chromosomal replication initiator protein